MTNVEVTHKTVDPAGLRFETLTADNMPVVELHALSNLDDGTRAVEFQYRVDHGVWHPFTRERVITLRDDWLRVQGRHTVFMRSRVVGEPMSLDPNPAQAEVVIDVDPPVIHFGKADQGKVMLEVTDPRHQRSDGALPARQGAWERVAACVPGPADPGRRRGPDQRRGAGQRGVTSGRPRRRCCAARPTG